VAFTAVLAGASWYMMTPTIQFLFPKYIAGAEAAQWALIPVVFRSLLPIGNVFFVTKQSSRFALSVLLGMAAYGIFFALTVGHGENLVVMSQSWTIGRAVQLAAVLFLMPKTGSKT